MSELAKHRTRLAIPRAVTLEINCPHCGEPQPDPHRNSTIWTVAEARAASVAPNDRRNCVSCDGIIIFDVSGKVDLL